MALHKIHQIATNIVKKIRKEALTLAPLADYFFAIGRIQDAYNVALRGSNAAQQIHNSSLQAQFYSVLASCNQNFGNFEKAVEYGKRCYELDVIEGNSASISSSLNNLAVIALSMEHYSDAKNYIDEAIQIEKQLGRDDVLAVRYGIASEVYVTLKMYPEALNFSQKAYDLNTKTGNKAKAAIRMCQIAATYQAMGDDDNAQKMYIDAIEPLTQAGNLRSLSICYNALGTISAKKDNIAESEKYFLKAVDMAQDCSYTLQEQKAYNSLAQLLRNTRPSTAVTYYEMSAALRDSLFNDASERQINNFNVLYQTHQKERQVEMQQLQIERQRTTEHMMIIIIVLAAISVVVLVLLVLSLRHRNRDLQEISNMKSKFFSIISHDLKNPVLAQKTALELICKNYSSLPASVLQEQCVELMHSSGTLLELLYNLLNWSRLETGRMSYAPIRFDMHSVYNNVADVLKTQLANKQIALANNLPQDVFVFADRNMITIVLRNIIGNAIKFSHPNSQISVEAKLHKNNWVFSVTDSGVGIDNETLSSLFRLKNYRSSIGTAGEQGTGLGLVLCHEMVKMNGGTIKVTSSKGEGTVVQFSLLASCKS